jgi:hypothetical protein
MTLEIDLLNLPIISTDQSLLENIPTLDLPILEQVKFYLLIELKETKDAQKTLSEENFERHLDKIV